MAAHPRGEQRLVAVAHGGIGDKQLPLMTHPVGDSLRALLFEQIACAHHGFGAGSRGLWRAHCCSGALEPFCLGVPVHRDVGDIGQHFCRPVASLFKREQLWRLVDKFSVVAVVEEGRMFQQVFDKCNIRRHAPDAEFA